MRGSSLVFPPVLEALRPFIVAWASARTVEEFPEDVRSLLGPDGRRPRNMNLGLLVLDADGKLLRQAAPSVRPPAFRFDPEAQGRDFQRQVDELLAGLPLPKARPAARKALALPDVPGDAPFSGARIVLTFGANRLNHYRTPTVEAAPTTPELRAALRCPEEAVPVVCEKLRPWLDQIYPPAIMDGQGGFESIEGSLTLRPAGQIEGRRCALLEGDIAFALDNKTRIRYEGRLSVVVEYAGEDPDPVRVRGLCACEFPKHDPSGRTVERIRMTATIESRPR